MKDGLRSGSIFVYNAMKNIKHKTQNNQNKNKKAKDSELKKGFNYVLILNFVLNSILTS